MNVVASQQCDFVSLYDCVKSISLVTVSVRQMKIDKVSGIAHSCTQGEHVTRKLRGKRVSTNLGDDIIEEELCLLKVKCRNVVVTKDEATLFPLRIKESGIGNSETSNTGDASHTLLKRIDFQNNERPKAPCSFLFEKNLLILASAKIRRQYSCDR